MTPAAPKQKKRTLSTHQATIIAKAMWEKQQTLHPSIPWDNVSAATKAHAIGCARIAVRAYLSLTLTKGNGRKK